MHYLRFTRFAMVLSFKTLAIAALAATVVADEPEPLQQYSWYKKYTAQPDIYRFYGCYEAVQFIGFNWPDTGDYYKDGETRRRTSTHQ